VRHAFGTVQASAAYTGVRSKNIMTFYWANENFVCPPRSFAGCFSTTPHPRVRQHPAGRRRGKTWYDALQLKVDRPTSSTRPQDRLGRGAGGDAGRARDAGLQRPVQLPQRDGLPAQRRNDEPLRIVANWVVDVPFALGRAVQRAAEPGLGSRVDVGGRFDCNNANTCFEGGGFSPPKQSFIIPNAFAYRHLDLRLRKDFVNVRGTRLGVTADLFNAFNFTNSGCFHTFDRNNPELRPVSRCTVSDPRRLQIGAEFNHRSRELRTATANGGNLTQSTRDAGAEAWLAWAVRL
jgi:hypothetical protein